MKLTIAIPTYKNWTQLVECLLSLTRYVEFPYKIVVVNNGPARDDSTGFEEALHKAVPYPFLKVIQAPGNLGWQKAINLAFEQECDTEFFCMANDDLLFLPFNREFLRKLCAPFKYEEVGAVGPVSNFVMGSQNFRVYAHMVYQTTLLIGFFMVVRSKLFSEIGGLDDGLPGGDDLDLSILIRKAGKRLVVDRTCYVHHWGSQTGHRVHDYWNTHQHSELTNNVLIAKHGLKAWYETIQSKVELFDPLSFCTDSEGDQIRAWVGKGKGYDLGCGGNKTIASAVGVDLTPKGERGKAGGAKLVDSQADVVADVTLLDFIEDGSADYLVARHIFEHLIDPVAALAEWRRVLRRGGRLAIACPNEEACASILLDWSHVHAWTPASLSRLLEICGFQVLEQSATGISLLILAQKPEEVSEAVA